MRISDLLVALKDRADRHGDVEVITTWEGTDHAIVDSNLYLGKDGKLRIDADSNSYKHEEAVDPNEGVLPARLIADSGDSCCQCPSCNVALWARVCDDGQIVGDDPWRVCLNCSSLLLWNQFDREWTKTSA